MILLDLSSNFSILKLQSILQSHISASLSAAHESSADPIEVSTLVHACLQHLHVFRPQSHPSLLATVAALPAYLLSELRSHYSANRRLGAIFVNNLGSFYWQDRQEAEEQRDAALVAENGSAVNKDDLFLARYRSLVKCLREVQQAFDCPIVATTWALAPPIYSRDGSSLRSHLPTAWNNFCTFKVVLQRSSVTKFGPGMSVEEALAEKEQRQEAVDRSGFSGWVNWWDSEAWREDIKTAVMAWIRRGGARFTVSDQGIAFGGDHQLS